ncbi:hypothetical protein B0A68_21695 [Flavobacterium reichenbachii]|uniref:Uncharacterized protein n=2 Tax=Flavobacterium reichenbachii TaxID=362418 RepID=A0A085ZPW4_9FLAO|nr:hypothetical protein IW19_13600 [Flavobacterium reichenbachii]OXB11045.1 hypothetical protein B0A68_21695 [Flavobacterium reichenbachii]
MKYLLFSFLLFSCFTFSQTKSILENIKIDKNTKLIGMYPQYDKNKTYKNLNFYINDQNIITDLINKLSYEKIVKNRIERNDFRILVLQGNEVLENWMLSPANSNINMNGTFYEFNFKIIKELSKKYPFDYTFFKKEFSTQKEYDAFVLSLRKDNKFLFSYEPDFKFEGTFQIKFLKNSQFPNPKVIDEYLRPKILKIAKESEFNITYILDNYNKENTDQYTMTIEANKDIFDKLKLENLKQKNWQNNIATGMFFMRKI